MRNKICPFKSAVLLIAFTLPFTAEAQERSGLPEATGEYAVGTTVRYFEDRSREEVWTTEPGDSRRLAVQIWYPAAERTGTVAPYVFGLDRIRPSIEKYWEGIPRASTNAYIDAKPRKTERGYPVVVFSHGMNSPRFVYTAISRELASHGYLVAAIDHPFWGPAVAFENGAPVLFEESMIQRDTLGSDEIDSMMTGGVDTMAADQAFVAEKILELNRSDTLLKGIADVTLIASAGHSMGGMAATVSCLRYRVFKACISLDGVFYFLNKMPTPSRKPYLLLLNSQWGRNAPEKIAVRYLEAFESPEVAILNGSKHSYFSDIPLIEPSASGSDLIKPERAFRIVAGEVSYFLQEHFRGKREGSQRAPEVEPINLRKVRDSKTQAQR
ncbi:MAG: hypothetical protein DWQ47_10385 [Acidobacteria bacterium]|nr:MAG: hypothetical protein DWQ32_12800 [Acidobacteriota bacterium]REJ97992.1 MAG: hypothetical protein DWQ38_15600 [Acidobacteriota bacterium]REK16735.1 MAG: hypothetical protein DWQ43_00645 [Acidobacteriota bacterium]REK42646.1 MAG: hypothetical protein DWQ47_10385 [Acidobacteriota bacterium]